MKYEFLTQPAARQILKQISTQIELNPAHSSFFHQLKGKQMEGYN